MWQRVHGTLGSLNILYDRDAAEVGRLSGQSLRLVEQATDGCGAIGTSLTIG